MPFLDVQMLLERTGFPAMYQCVHCTSRLWVAESVLIAFRSSNLLCRLGNPNLLETLVC